MLRDIVVSTDLSPGAVRCSDVFRIGAEKFVLIGATDVRETQGLSVSMQEYNLEHLEQEVKRLREKGFAGEVEAPSACRPGRSFVPLTGTTHH